MLKLIKFTYFKFSLLFRAIRAIFRTFLRRFFIERVHMQILNYRQTSLNARFETGPDDVHLKRSDCMHQVRRN